MDRTPSHFVSMACANCGYTLDRLSSNVCPECGSPYDPDDPDTFRPLLPDRVRLLESSVFEASRLQACLAAQGIVASVEEARDVLGRSRGSLWVSRDDLEQAAAAVSGAMSEPPPMASWQCDTCGETIEGQFSACWSCGTSKSDEDVPLAAQANAPSRKKGPIPVTFVERLLLYSTLFLTAVGVLQLWALAFPSAFLGAATAITLFVGSRLFKVPT